MGQVQTKQQNEYGEMMEILLAGESHRESYSAVTVIKLSFLPPGFMSMFFFLY
jgi:hypothetical protein